MIDLATIIGNNVALMRNTIGRQLRVKLLCRSVVRVLPAKAKERSLRGLLVCLVLLIKLRPA
jgi:hypothetical protein